VQLFNNSDYPAKYTLAQPDRANPLAGYDYTTEEFSGIVAPNSVKSFDLQVTYSRLGQIGTFPIVITIDGCEDNPIIIAALAEVVGPSITLSTKELDWGKIPVLENRTLTVDINNTSPISANLSCSTVEDQSVYHIEPFNNVIQPGESLTLTLVAFLNDTLTFNDILKI
jgi:hypothetical protein